MSIFNHLFFYIKLILKPVEHKVTYHTDTRDTDQRTGHGKGPTR